MKVGETRIIERYLLLPRWFKGQFYWLRNVRSKYEYVKYQVCGDDSMTLSVEQHMVEEWKLIEMDVVV